jgi:FKBP-type peptidyl-prolyl cis-trans isomerase FklB
MNRRIIVTVSMMAVMSVAMAQKPSAQKQDEIIEGQKALDVKLDEVIKLQNEVQSLYGSDMNMENEVTKVSYAYGLSIGENMKSQGIANVDFFAMNKGLLDAFTNGKDQKMTIQEAQQFLNDYIGQLMAMRAEQAKVAGQKWLAENAKKPGVKVTESGLQYEVMKGAEGAKPGPKTEVTVHYHGMLTNGDVFDSSVDRGTPATFGLDKVIPGWTEGLQLMSEGSKYKFYISSELGYGERSPGGAIGPNEVLVFEVELLSVKK